MVEEEIVLEPQLPKHKGMKTLVLDLDETLVHSSFTPLEKCDLVLPVRFLKSDIIRLKSMEMSVKFTSANDQELIYSWKKWRSAMS